MKRRRRTRRYTCFSSRCYATRVTIESALVSTQAISFYNHERKWNTSQLNTRILVAYESQIKGTCVPFLNPGFQQSNFKTSLSPLFFSFGVLSGDHLIVSSTADCAGCEWNGYLLHCPSMFLSAKVWIRLTPVLLPDTFSTNFSSLKSQSCCATPLKTLFYR